MSLFGLTGGQYLFSDSQFRHRDPLVSSWSKGTMWRPVGPHRPAGGQEVIIDELAAREYRPMGLFERNTSFQISRRLVGLYWQPGGQSVFIDEMEAARQPLWTRWRPGSLCGRPGDKIVFIDELEATAGHYVLSDQVEASVSLHINWRLVDFCIPAGSL